MNVIKAMNDYLSEGENFAATTQNIVMFLVLLTTTAIITENNEYVIPLAWLVLILPLVTFAKIILLDWMRDKKPFPTPDGIAYAMVCFSTILTGMLLQAAPNVLLSSTEHGDAFELLYASFMAIGGLGFFFALYVVKYTPFFKYEETTPVPAAIRREQPKPAPKQADPPKQEPPKPAAKPTPENLPDIFATSSIEEQEYADLL
jgi:hypothetical protein